MLLFLATDRDLDARPLLRQLIERQLDHAEKVVAREPILVEHLQHQLVLGRVDAQDELLVPLRVERPLLRLGELGQDGRVTADLVYVNAHVRVAVRVRKWGFWEIN